MKRRIYALVVAILLIIACSGYSVLADETSDIITEAFNVFIAKDYEKLQQYRDNFTTDLYAYIQSEEYGSFPETLQYISKYDNIWFIQAKEDGFDTYYMYKLHIEDDIITEIVRYELFQ